MDLRRFGTEACRGSPVVLARSCLEGVALDVFEEGEEICFFFVDLLCLAMDWMIRYQ